MLLNSTKHGFIGNAELSELTNKLSSHMKNKLFFNPTPFKVQHNVLVYESFTTKNLRQSFFDKCTIDGADFTKAGLSGSVFVDCMFKPSSFWDTNLQACDFRSCTFENIEFKYTRMNKSVFYNVVFSKCVFISVSICDAIFESCIFDRCQWTPISVENTVFRNTSLDSVKMHSMNLEFATFDNICIKNTKLPFPTIPFVFNGLTYLTKTNDPVRITSATKEVGLSVEEYLGLLATLKQFYSITKNYFPLANIFLAQGNDKEATASIVYGIDTAIMTRSFRMLNYFCKQINYVESLDPHIRQEIYSRILLQASRLDLKEFERNSLSRNLALARKELFEKATHYENIQISIQTGIDCEETDKLSILLSVIDHLLRDYGQYSIEIRHNSPFDVFVNFFSKAENIAVVISSLGLVFEITKFAIERKNKVKREKEEDERKRQEEKLRLKSNGVIIESVIVNHGGTVYISDTKKTSILRVED